MSGEGYPVHCGRWDKCVRDEVGKQGLAPKGPACPVQEFSCYLGVDREWVKQE